MTNELEEKATIEPEDSMLESLVSYTIGVDFDSLKPEAVYAAKARIIDTIGALLAGFDGEPCQVARRVARKFYASSGATIIGTDRETTLEMAAFVNGTTARYAELNDIYYHKGSAGGHPSDFIMPLIAVAEYVEASGKDLIAAIVLAYEIYISLGEATPLVGFDNTNLDSIATAAAAGKLLGLKREQLAHAISIDVTANNALRQARTGDLSMWKAAAAGQAGRAGVSAALLASEGMEGPRLPFEGVNAWFDHVAHQRFNVNAIGENGTSIRVAETYIKPRGACAWTISSILAAEKLCGKFGDDHDVEEIVVETYRRAIEKNGSGAHRWNPTTRESADHSIPYVVATGLRDGIVGKTQFDDAHLNDEDIRILLKKVVVVENEGFTKQFEGIPNVCPTRITVVKRDGERIVGESGGDKGDLATFGNQLEIEEKFLRNSLEWLSVDRARNILDVLWSLDSMDNIAVIPRLVIL